MNLPNKLTILRFVLAPVYLILMMLSFEHHLLVAFIMFIFAAFTDMLDGQIARKQNLITNFGKFLDPIADKMLTTAAFLAFTALSYGIGILWITFIVLTREFVVASVRMLAAGGNNVIAADNWGKIKTVVQMIAIGATIFFEYLIKQFAFFETYANILQISYTILLWLSAILTIISGVKYLIDNKVYINHNI